MLGKGEHLKDEGSRLQVVAAGATAGLISRFVDPPTMPATASIKAKANQHSSSPRPQIRRRPA